MKPDYASRENNLQQMRRKQPQDVMIIFKSIAVACFFILRLNGIYTILNRTSNSFKIKDKSKFTRVLCIYLLSSLSTAINPVILFTFSTNFRQALQKLCPFYKVNAVRVFMFQCTEMFLSQN